MIGNNPLYGWDRLGHGHAWWCPMAAYSWVMTGDRNASSDVLDSAHQGFREGLTEKYYQDYWSDKFVENDLALAAGFYADYAFWSGAGISVGVEFSVSKGFSVEVAVNANLGYALSAGVYVGASIKSDLSLPLQGANVNGGIEIKGPVGGGVSSGNGRNGMNISVGAGWGKYGTVSVPLF